MIANETDRSGAGTVVAAAAGVVAPLVFVILVAAQGLRHSDYSHTELPVSALAAWPHGWVQSLNFLVLGSGMAAFAAALHRGVPSGRTGIIGPLLLASGGIGLLLAAAFPWRRLDGSFIVPSGHLVGAVLTFLGAGAGLVVISRRMESDLRWRSMAAYALASGLAVLVLFLLTMFVARPEDGPLHAWLGLLQRLILLVWFPCMIVVSWRILHTTAQAAKGETAIQ